LAAMLAMLRNLDVVSNRSRASPRGAAASVRTIS
jgi:hypothetical protein